MTYEQLKTDISKQYIAKYGINSYILLKAVSSIIFYNKFVLGLGSGLYNSSNCNLIKKLI